MKHLYILLLLSWASLQSSAFALERQPDAAYAARRQALAQHLDGGLAILFAGQEPLLDFMPFRQDADFYYLTGWNEPGAALMVVAPTPASANHAATPYREILFLPTRNLRIERYTGAKLDASAPDAAKQTGVAEVKPMGDLAVMLNGISTSNPVTGRFWGQRKFWIQEDVQQARQLLQWTSTTLGIDRAPEQGDVRSATETLRSEKDAGELTLLRKASDASIVAQRAAIEAVRPGVNEHGIAGLLVGTAMAQGCERASYAPIVGSGKNSTVLHYSDDNQMMQSGDVVVMDAAGEYSMYASDITRTVPVNGHFTDRQREVYNIVLGAQRAAVAAFVAGKSRINDPSHKYADSLDGVAYNYMNSHGKDLHGQPLGQYFIHGLGHSVGIDVHDPFNYARPLEIGAVFTIEPGIYIPEENLGVRIEDVFYVGSDGKLVDLIAALPHTAEEVESLMKHHVDVAGELRRQAEQPALAPH